MFGIKPRKSLEKIVNSDNLLLLLGEKKRDIYPMFKHLASSRKYTSPKVVAYFSSLPSIEETGNPFMVISNLSIPQSEILKAYPSATVLYLADNKKHEQQIREENSGSEVVVVNADYIRNENVSKQIVGTEVKNMFFNKVAEAHFEGVTDMAAIVRGISDEIKSMRDTILFSTSYWKTKENEYYKMQNTYRFMPMILQSSDDALMDACPEGDCLRLFRPIRGDCYDMGNLPEILINFVIKYRKKVGEESFIEALKQFHSGEIKEPWYMEEKDYLNSFDGLEIKSKKEENNMRF